MSKVIGQYVEVNSILALVSRFPETRVAETESNLAKLQDKYPANTNIGAFVANLRNLLKNQRALKWFDFLERAGIKRFEELVHSKPELFAPLFHSFERVMDDVAKEMPDSSSVPATNFQTKSLPEMNQASSQLLLTKLRSAVEMCSSLANISRITPEAASEIDTAFADFLKTTHGEDTPFGQSLMRMRTILKNRRSLEWFDFLEKAGVQKLEQFLASKQQ